MSHLYRLYKHWDKYKYMIECRGNGRVNIDWLERNKIILNTDGVFVKGSDRNSERYIKDTLNNASYTLYISEREY